MSKGSLMAISGRIQTRSYDAKDGSKRYVTEVVANEVNFLSKGVKAEESQAQTGSFGNFGSAEYEDMTPVDPNEVPF